MEFQLFYLVFVEFDHTEACDSLISVVRDVTIITLQSDIDCVG